MCMQSEDETWNICNQIVERTLISLILARLNFVIFAIKKFCKRQVSLKKLEIKDAKVSDLL